MVGRLRLGVVRCPVRSTALAHRAPWLRCLRHHDNRGESVSIEEDYRTNETAKERVDRELVEMLNGLRVILPGVQVLFAFLLAIPFAARFAETDAFQRDVLLVTAVASAVSIVLLIAPAAQHRILFRTTAKEDLLHRANRFAIAGVSTLAVALVS